MPRTKTSSRSSSHKDPRIRSGLERERKYEESKREQQREKARDYQRRRRELLKANPDEQATERARQVQWQDTYRRGHRWALLMIEKRRANSENPNHMERRSTLRYPQEVDAVGHAIHEVFNEEKEQRRKMRSST